MQTFDDIHPAARAALIDPDTAAGGPVTKELLAATFTDTQLKLVCQMLRGYREIFDIDYVPLVARADGDKLSHMMMVYPFSVAHLLIAEPTADIIDRLAKRGVDIVKIRGGFLLIAWPIAEAIKLAEVWADADAAGFTPIKFTPTGIIAGTIQRF